MSRVIVLPVSVLMNRFPPQLYPGAAIAAAFIAVIALDWLAFEGALARRETSEGTRDRAMSSQCSGVVFVTFPKTLSWILLSVAREVDSAVSTVEDSTESQSQFCDERK